MKRIVIVLALLLILVLPCAAAPVADQVLELRTENGTLALVATKPVTFWETPRLQAGEIVTVNGTLTLKNSTDINRDFTFWEVAFPYEDTAALEYLNHLQIQVLKADSLLYEGPYSGINDASVRPALNCTVAAGESVTYTIRLKCDHAYGGNTYIGDAVLDWKFHTPLTENDVSSETTPSQEPFQDPILWQWLLGGGIAVVVFVSVLLISKKQKT